MDDSRCTTELRQEDGDWNLHKICSLDDDQVDRLLNDDDPERR